MLKSIDIMIGVTVVMLVVSVVVTALTQFVLHRLNTRGKNLRTGVADLLQQIAPGFTRECADHIAQKVLLHPLIRESEKRLSAAVHREELAKLILELATTEGPHQLDPPHRKSLLDALAKDGIKDPEGVLKNVRSMSLNLELSNPEMSTAMRSGIALLQEAHSEFLGKMNAWFDQTIDRVVDRFTAQTRAITFTCAFAVALVLQLDTASLVNRLSTDPALRQALVEQALAIERQEVAGGQNQGATQTSPAAGQNQTPTDTTAAGQNQAATDTNTATARAMLTADIQSQKESLRDMARLGLVDFPRSVSEWTSRWSADNGLPKLLGILLSTVLLSFGAPFWYNALKTLLRFRSVIASKDDDQRKERQTTTAPVGAPPARAAAAEAGAGPGGSALAGERGFMGTLG